CARLYLQAIQEERQRLRWAAGIQANTHPGQARHGGKRDTVACPTGAEGERIDRRHRASIAIHEVAQCPSGRATFHVEAGGVLQPRCEDAATQLRIDELERRAAIRDEFQRRRAKLMLAGIAGHGSTTANKCRKAAGIRLDATLVGAVEITYR